MTTFLLVLLAFTALALVANQLQKNTAARRTTEDEHATRNTGDTYVSNLNSFYVLAQNNPEPRQKRVCTLNKPPYGLI